VSYKSGDDDDDDDDDDDKWIHKGKNERMTGRKT
jgi:hypothetical protein